MSKVNWGTEYVTVYRMRCGQCGCVCDSEKYADVSGAVDAARRRGWLVPENWRDDPAATALCPACRESQREMEATDDRA